MFRANIVNAVTARTCERSVNLMPLAPVPVPGPDGGASGGRGDGRAVAAKCAAAPRDFQGIWLRRPQAVGRWSPLVLLLLLFLIVIFILILFGSRDAGGAAAGKKAYDPFYGLLYGVMRVICVMTRAERAVPAAA